jgi:hypothetical protein
MMDSALKRLAIIALGMLALALKGVTPIRGE